MTGTLTRVLGFFLLALLQTSLLASLPFPLNSIPLVFVAGIWLIQQESSVAGAAWIIGMGLWMDLWGLSFVPWQTVGFSIAAIVATVSARKLFSHRSLYGIVSCYLVAAGCTLLWDIAVQFILSLSHPEASAWSAWVLYRVWETGLGIVLIWFVFSSTKHLRRLLGIRTA